MAEERQTVLDLFERSERSFALNTAIALPERNVTYGELGASSRLLAGALLEESKQPVIALFFPMSPEFVTAYFATLYAGRQALPLNLMLPPEELKYILNDSGADIILAPAEFVEKLAPLGVKVCSYQGLLEKAAKTGQVALPARPEPDSICTLLYTSGTTGKPKGVMLSHGNLASNAAGAVASLHLDADHRFLACLPSFHTFAITATMLVPLSVGASLSTLGKFDPEVVVKTISGLKCNSLLMVPSMYRIVTRMQERRPLDMSHLKLAVAGGEALPVEVRERFEQVFKIPLLEGFGQTESGPVVSLNLPWANLPGTVGKPIVSVQVRTVDPESLQETHQGTGEIWVKSPSVMKGYHNKPEETAKTLTADGWLRTGDMGEITPEGYIRITGRLREMIKVAGEMVFPAEVENIIYQHPAVSEVGVTGVKDDRKGEAVKAFVVLKSGENATEEDLLQHCRTKMAAYKVPKTIEFRTELPKGPTGKVVRRFLK